MSASSPAPSWRALRSNNRGGSNGPPSQRRHRVPAWFGPRHLAQALLLHFLVQAPVAAQEPSEANEAFLRGKELAQKHCGVCHLFTGPELLDKATWRNGTMPFLRGRLGMDRLDPNHPGEKIVLEEWNLVWKYYLAAAPETPIPQPQRAKIEKSLRLFNPELPGYRPGKPFVTLLQIDSEARRIYAGNAETKTLDVLDAKGTQLSALQVESPPVGLAQRPSGWFCTLIGRVPPHDQRLGKLILLDKQGDAFSFRADVVTHLPRPTDCAFGDLNKDGREDLILSSFGNVFGELTWHERTSDGSYRRHVLSDQPGAVRTEVRDFNNDGHLDILVMMAQARERLFILINDGRGEFTETPVLEQHPVWGYAGFQLVDFDQDGHPDILTANGDNGEYVSCTKNYHGVRLYLNDGANKFTEKFFYPLNGAFKAVAADFDGDRDLDIAAISYFPDYDRSPEESFVYLENVGGFNFRAFSLPEAMLGRWLVMDAGDLEGDGDLDLVLGAANRTPYQVSPALYEKWTKEGPTILILRNNSTGKPAESDKAPKEANPSPAP